MYTNTLWTEFWLIWLIHTWIFSLSNFEGKFRRTIVSYEIHKRNEVNKDSHHIHKDLNKKQLNSHSLKDCDWNSDSDSLQHCCFYFWVEYTDEKIHDYRTKHALNTKWWWWLQPTSQPAISTGISFNLRHNENYRNSPHQWFTPNRFHSLTHRNCVKGVDSPTLFSWVEWVWLWWKLSMCDISLRKIFLFAPEWNGMLVSFPSKWMSDGRTDGRVPSSFFSAKKLQLNAMMVLLYCKWILLLVLIDFTVFKL